MLISIICVYNNKEILEKYLLESLKTQNEEYELILIDNRENKFNSAASALNYGGKKSKGEILIFVHQDVEFYENNLKDIKYYFKFEKIFKNYLKKKFCILISKVLPIDFFKKLKYKN